MLNLFAACAVACAAIDTAPPERGASDAAMVTLASSSPRPEPAPVARSLAGLSPAARAAARPRKYEADSMVVDKSDRTLVMYRRGVEVHRYVIALGRNPVGDKERRGDGRTPEGLYYIEGRNPRSKFHLSLRVSYPSARQRDQAARRGVSPGGDIMLHGLPPAFASVGALHRQQDWTEGCIALTNDEIEEIWRAVPDGARILIQP